ncbi:MAG TPA: hypothetical protein VGB66_04060, partial [Longimicrobium sp.]
MKLRVLALVLAAIAGSHAAHAQIAVSSTVEERSAAPGESYTGTIRVRNTSGRAQEIKAYQTDYSFFADGRTVYAAAGTSARSNARWIT